MKKLSIFAVAIAAMAFTACGGNKSAEVAEQTDSVKSFEQEQVEAKIKVELDSLAAEVGKLKQLPIVQKRDDGHQADRSGEAGEARLSARPRYGRERHHTG